MATLDHFRVGRFRGLTDCELESLGQINLLVGGGNSGKTSILEAIAAFSAPVDLGEWSRISRAREVRGLMIQDSLPTSEAIRWMFPHVRGDELSDDFIPDEHDDIFLSAEGNTPVLEVRASCEFVQGEPVTRRTYRAGRNEEFVVDDEGWKFSLRAEVAIEGLLPETETLRLEHIIMRSEPARFDRLTSPRIRSVFLPPYAHRNQPQQLGQLSRATASDEKSDVVRLLRELDADILGLEIITDKFGVRPLLAVRHRTIGLAPISTFGDGVRRAVMIALSIPRARDGFLLLDEIEAALHTSALDRIMPWLVNSCAAYNVQVFATTHSLEAVDSIASLVGEMSHNFCAYHLNKHGENVKRYGPSMLRRLVHERGLDIR